MSVWANPGKNSSFGGARLANRFGIVLAWISTTQMKSSELVVFCALSNLWGETDFSQDHVIF